ncbi:hypothetical protein L9F63_022091, partial [Diploptera punctata]
MPGTELVPGRAWDGGLNGEPSCEELRAMWRFSKRQSRATEITNEIPTYRDPFAYNVWEPYARSRSVAGGRARGRGGHVYGRIVHTAPRARARDSSPERFRAYEEVAARLIGSGHQAPIPRRKVTSFRLSGGASLPVEPLPHFAAQPGTSFQQVKDLIRTERARELQEQRMAEEAAARAAALRGLTSDSYYGQVVQEPPSFEPLHYKSMPMPQRKGSLLAFPDLLASTTDQDAQIYKHRSTP